MSDKVHSRVQLNVNQLSMLQNVPRVGYSTLLPNNTKPASGIGIRAMTN